VAGFDVNAPAVERGRARLPGIDLSVGDVAASDGRGPFNAIAALDVLEHVPELDDALDHLAGTLTADGVLLAVMPVYDGPLGWVVHTLDKDPTHVHKRSREWWLEKLGSRFTVTDWHGAVRGVAPGGTYVHRPTRRLRQIAPAIVVQARPRT